MSVLDLALRLRIPRTAEHHTVADLFYEILEPLHEYDIAEVLADDEDAVLIVHYRLRSSAEIAKGKFVRLDRGVGVKGLAAEIDEVHPAVGEHHAEEIHPDLPAVHIEHLALAEIHLRFIPGRRFLTEFDLPAGELLKACLLYKLQHVTIKRAARAVEIRKGVLNLVI